MEFFASSRKPLAASGKPWCERNCWSVVKDYRSWMSGYSEGEMEAKQIIWPWFGNREGKGGQAHRGGGLQQ